MDHLSISLTVQDMAVGAVKIGHLFSKGFHNHAQTAAYLSYTGHVYLKKNSLIYMSLHTSLSPCNTPCAEKSNTREPMSTHHVKS